ncbi:hypothetical protein [Methylotenera versatilis]|uniref:Prolin-rich transmembrane protein n=1 Tax=Methylotenera versatilis (strain 301) TaxID=666681 RepID=D7DNU7_METV0|nr:hypothetical protein [Methylotenera versatilis]ADI29114.1 hypothetical protein M301_0730 [Methylotenera versatilis 301]
MVSVNSTIKIPMMKKSTNESSKWLYIVLFITLGITIWTALHKENPSDEAIELVPNKFASNTKNHHSPSVRNSQHDNIQTNKTESVSNSYSLIPWQGLQREPLVSTPHDAFKVHSWVVITPAKKVKPLPPPPPVAPNTPFIYAGKLENSPKGTQVFLLGNNKLYSVVMGEKVDMQWRLDSEDANTLQFTYLPLNLKQVLSKSAKQTAPIAEEINQ